MRKQTKISMPRIEVEDRDRTLSDGWCQANATAGTLVGVLVTNAGFTSTLAEANPSGVKAFSKGAMPTTQTFTSPLLDPVVRIRLPWFGTHAIFVTHELPALKRPMKNPRPFLKKTSSLGHSGESSTREGGGGITRVHLETPRLEGNPRVSRCQPCCQQPGQKASQCSQVGHACFSQMFSQHSSGEWSPETTRRSLYFQTGSDILPKLTLKRSSSGGVRK